MIQNAKECLNEIDLLSSRRELIAQFENAYLSRSVSRLLDPVNLMFSETKAPTHENVDGLVRTITRYPYDLKSNKYFFMNVGLVLTPFHSISVS